MVKAASTLPGHSKPNCLVRSSPEHHSSTAFASCSSVKSGGFDVSVRTPSVSSMRRRLSAAFIMCGVAVVPSLAAATSAASKWPTERSSAAVEYRMARALKPRPKRGVPMWVMAPAEKRTSWFSGMNESSALPSRMSLTCPASPLGSGFPLSVPTSSTRWPPMSHPPAQTMLAAAVVS